MMKKINLKFLVGMFAITALTLFVSCDKNEESFTEQATEKTLLGDYTKLNSTIINSGTGTPQNFGNLKACIGEELQLSDDGSFKSSTGHGHWIKEGNILYLNSVKGQTMNFEIQKNDDKTLNLIQKYNSYDHYANGVIAYTFIKKERK